MQGKIENKIANKLQTLFILNKLVNILLNLVFLKSPIIFPTKVVECILDYCR